MKRYSDYLLREKPEGLPEDGSPDPTFEEAASRLGMSKDEFMDWLTEQDLFERI